MSTPACYLTENTQLPGTSNNQGIKKSFQLDHCPNISRLVETCGGRIEFDSGHRKKTASRILLPSNDLSRPAGSDFEESRPVKINHCARKLEEGALEKRGTKERVIRIVKEKHNKITSLEGKNKKCA